MDYIEDINNTIKPNYMQRKALKELRRYRDMGVNKALIVSATGFFWAYTSLLQLKKLAWTLDNLYFLMVLKDAIFFAYNSLA